SSTVISGISGQEVSEICLEKTLYDIFQGVFRKYQNPDARRINNFMDIRVFRKMPFFFLLQNSFILPILLQVIIFSTWRQSC
ncbi:MAG: hypothetical protein IJ061_06825, partial [Lachnospiraceae bacterium]|nr:hypothetical protein [Lachnospiraceae bacterium]